MLYLTGILHLFSKIYSQSKYTIFEGILILFKQINIDILVSDIRVGDANSQVYTSRYVCQKYIYYIKIFLREKNCIFPN